MKIKFKQLLGIFTMLCVAFLMSCEGPEGPAGADGQDGADGTNGADGVDGVDANAHCTECHSMANWADIEAQYEASGHNAGLYVGYAGGRGSCAQCHSHDGFINFINNPTGDFPDIAFPTAISCETCHGNHGNLEEGLEVPIRTVAAVTAISDGTEFDFENNSNLCSNCHQSRRDYSYYEAIDSVEIDDVMIAVGAGEIGINSTHAGPHHGPQVNFIFGNGGYGTSGTSAHTALGCTSCHMSESDGEEGGHTFYPNVANCTECHEGATGFDIGGFQTDVAARLGVIAEALVTAGALSGDATEGYHPHVSIVTENEFKAFWNYMMVYEDHSHGVHNPSYTETLLTGAETWLGITK